MAKAIYKIDTDNGREYKNENDANRALFDMRRAYSAADHADQIKRAAIISDILRNSFLRHASF